MEKPTGDANRLVEAIREMKGVKTLRGGQESDAFLHIKNIDAVTSEQEIEDIITDLVKEGELKGDIRIRSLRLYYGGTQAATVFMPRG